MVVVAEGEVAGFFRESDACNAPAIGQEDVDAAWPAAVHIALLVDLHAIGHAGLVARCLGELSTGADRSVGPHVVDVNDFARTVVHIQTPFIRAETKSVGLLEVDGEPQQ